MLQPNESTVGGRIRKSRIELEMTLKDLAQQVGVTPNYLSVVERSEKPPSPALLQKIAKATRTSYTWLLTGESGPEAVGRAGADTGAHVDPQMFLSLVLMRVPGVTRKDLTALLMTDDATVDAILAGEDVDYDRRWANTFQNLAQGMDIGAVRRELKALDSFLSKQEKLVGREALLRSLREYASKKSEAFVNPGDYKIYCPIERQEVQYAVDNEGVFTADASHMILRNKLPQKDFWHFLFLPLPAAVSKESVHDILISWLNLDRTLDRSDMLSIVVANEEVYERFLECADDYLDYHHLQFEDPTGSITDAFPIYTSVILVDKKNWAVQKDKELIDEEYENWKMS